MPIFVGTASSTFMTSNSVGVGTTTTTGRDAGIGTENGAMIFNMTASAAQVWTGDQWEKMNNTPVSAKTSGQPAGLATVTSGGYTYHLFHGPGNFTILTGNPEVEVFVIGGGGAGGTTEDGGGNYRAGGARWCIFRC